MRYSGKFIGMMILGLCVDYAYAQTSVINGNPDGPIGADTQFAVTVAPAPTPRTANYAPVPISGVGSPLRLADDGTAIFSTINGGNVYAYRWRQGVVTQLTFVRPSGSQIKGHSANRNGMVVVTFELPGVGGVLNGVYYTKQFVVAWMPNSTSPIVVNVPLAHDTTWYGQNVTRSIEFKALDDQNRIWAITNHESASPEGNQISFELARWDTPDAEPTFIGHKKYRDPSVLLLGVGSGNGEPFGWYAPPDASPGWWATGFYAFAGSFSNRLNYVPSRMNSQRWVLGKRGFVPVLSRDGVEYALPANNSIALIDDRNNLFDINRSMVWTKNPQTLLSAPEDPQTPYVALPMRFMSLPQGYSSSRQVVPGDTALELDRVTKDGVTKSALFVPTELRPDANRDGAITVDRWPADPDRELAEKNLPWYYWTNDDNDAGETDGSDIPGEGSNGRDAVVNGTRDLVDFFPLHLDIAPLLRIFPPDGPGISYRLVQADGAANFLTTELSPAAADDYHRNPAIAATLSSRPVAQITAEGTVLDRAFLEQITAVGNGVILVEAREATTAPLRLEVWKDGARAAELSLPLSFAGVEDMFRHVNLVGAVGMKAETNARGSPPNWSQKLENDQAFVFVHGYNVNQRQARGWQAEFFKRLWWSGSRAQFWGVTWYGFESQVPALHFTPNYQLNVIHAFGTAPVFKQFIDELRANTGVTKVNVAGHSLGNMVVSSAISDYQAPIDRYFMIDAAVAAEAYDGAQGDGHVMQPDDGTAFLPHTEWNKERDGVYPPRLWASNWHRLFPPPGGNPATDDARAMLTWRDRFAPKAATPTVPATAYYDFHSTGEEVLGYDEQHTKDTPSLAGVLATELKTFLHITRPSELSQPNGYQTWLYQEQLKGRTTTGKILGSNYGGWGFNIFHFKKSPGGAPGRGPVLAPEVLRPDEITVAVLDQVFTPEVLREEPFFRPGGFWTSVGTWQYDATAKKNTWNNERLNRLYNPTTGSAFASAHRNTLLARMIPAMSPAAGRIPVPKLTADAGEERNFDMSSADIRGFGEPWLSPPLRNDKKWRHSDLREVAYPYVRGLYKRIGTLGNLGATTQ